MNSRHGIQIEERKALRRWAHRQHPKPTHKQCISWFLEQFGRKISQSTVSESLSSRFQTLDDNSTTNNLQRQRQREGLWPDLEKVLLAWQLRVEARGGNTSGELLQLKAKEIWRSLPQYNNKPVPEFSTGWLEGFKKRFNIGFRIRQGEALSTPEIAEEEMKGLQTIAGEYQEEDIYNMDETGLFWKMMPSRGLLTRSLPGLKKDKARISIVFCTNSTGTDRLPLWFIGSAKKPRSLRYISVSTMGGQWRANKKAWMTTAIMEEWLKAFYQYIGSNRQVLLTMDNFSAHYSAIEICSPPPNIRICWLPANSTSRFQPLDQGIIQNCKALYKRHWLKFILDKIDNNEDFIKTMSLHLAIRWMLRSWNNEVTNTTIYNCFRKSTLISIPISLPTPIIPPDFESLYKQVSEAADIQDPMAISRFLNPEDEDYGEEKEGHTVGEDELLQEVLNEYTELSEIQNDDPEEEELPQASEPVYTVSETKQALKVLIGFIEAQDTLSTKDLRLLERLESQIETIQTNSLNQSVLDRWFT